MPPIDEDACRPWVLKASDCSARWPMLLCTNTVSPWMSVTSFEMSLVACVVRSASLRTSSATTAKPRPAYETPPGFPRTGRFNRRVERQEVGLVGDFLDQVDDAADLFGAGLQIDDLFQRVARVVGELVHFAADVLHRLAATRGDVCRGQRFLFFLAQPVGQCGERLLRIGERLAVRLQRAKEPMQLVAALFGRLDRRLAVALGRLRGRQLITQRVILLLELAARHSASRGHPGGPRGGEPSPHFRKTSDSPVGLRWSQWPRLAQESHGSQTASRIHREAPRWSGLRAWRVEKTAKWRQGRHKCGGQCHCAVAVAAGRRAGSIAPWAAKGVSGLAPDEISDP